MSTILNLNIQAPLCSFHVPQDAAFSTSVRWKMCCKVSSSQQCFDSTGKKSFRQHRFFHQRTFPLRTAEFLPINVLHAVGDPPAPLLRTTDFYLTRDARFEKSRSGGNKKLAPRARFELATLRLTAECSTVELPGNRQVRSLFNNTM